MMFEIVLITQLAHERSGICIFYLNWKRLLEILAKKYLRN